MKKFLASIIALSILSTPALAQARDHYRDRDHTGEIIAGVLIGGIIGYAIGDSGKDRRYDHDYRYRDDHYNRNFRDRDYRYDNRHYRDRRHCVNERNVDRYGRTYYTRRCR